MEWGLFLESYNDMAFDLGIDWRTGDATPVLVSLNDQAEPPFRKAEVLSS